METFYYSFLPIAVFSTGMSTVSYITEFLLKNWWTSRSSMYFCITCKIEVPLRVSLILLADYWLIVMTEIQVYH